MLRCACASSVLEKDPIWLRCMSLNIPFVPDYDMASYASAPVVNTFENQATSRNYAPQAGQHDRNAHCTAIHNLPWSLTFRGEITMRMEGSGTT